MMDRFGSAFQLPQPGDVTELDTRSNQHLDRGYSVCIDKTWDNKPIEDHDPISIQMNWLFQKMDGEPHKRAIRVQITATLFDDPEAPNDFCGPCSDLYNYECVELFFMNEQGQYLEVELGPHGHWLVLLHESYRKCFNNGEEIELEVQNRFDGDQWICTAEIPLAYLPGAVTRFNCYALHGSGENRHYEALGPMTDGLLKTPDFHRKEYFCRFDSRRVIPEGYNRKPFNDLKYGDMWESVNASAE
ncbi:hypothetical protein M3Y96_00502100 [Aphelenchoides besseyi]|nr:hypothetical protein M3Y96_00502100 [Aphelenchoides besseyi]